MPANMVFGRELCLPCELLFRTSTNKEQYVTDYVADLVDQLHDIHHYAGQHLKVASDRMKAHYDCLANFVGFQTGDQVCLYHPTWTRGISPKLQPSREGLYMVITQINNAVFRIQQHPRVKMMVVHMNRLAPYLGATWDEQP
jgi:hypothetical protein